MTGLRNALNQHRPGRIRSVLLAIAIGALLGTWLALWWTGCAR